MYTQSELDKVRGCPVDQLDYYYNTRISRAGSEQLRFLFSTMSFVPALGALCGQQAVQQVKAGLKAIYVSGWQVAAAHNSAGDVYPDQSLYPVNSGPQLVREIHLALRRAHQIEYQFTGCSKNIPIPIIADGEAGFGGILNVFDLTLKFIEEGAAAVHFEDQLSSEKKCGHLGGKVLIPTSQFIKTLRAAQLAKEAFQPSLVLIARTDAESATYITSDIDPRDAPFVDSAEPRTSNGFYRYKNGIDSAIARALEYAPYCDVLWMETSLPDIEQAQQFAREVHAKFPGKWLAYNCSPSFEWNQYFSNLSDLKEFQRTLAAEGYIFQFITLAGFHAMNESMFSLSYDYYMRGMAAYSVLQQREKQIESRGYTSRRHQKDAGVGYFDTISEIIGNDQESALKNSTETTFQT